MDAIENWPHFSSSSHSFTEIRSFLEDSAVIILFVFYVILYLRFSLKSYTESSQHSTLHNYPKKTSCYIIEYNMQD